MQDAVLRSGEAVHQSVYNMYTQQLVMTPDAYHAFVARPGDMPIWPGGGSASASGAVYDVDDGVGDGGDDMSD
ncbi:hypothetical protein A2U01_0066305 [Trifolium medium]|uniref:Uncharacterized protein n=1 Tax=Trifolium medium TaxID=97028 RepID=A0A392SB38_9FABA|nr:hypothetical protein [Trifolium medium]